MRLRILNARLLPITTAAIGCVLAQRIVLVGWGLGAPNLPLPTLLGSAIAQAAESAPAATDRSDAKPSEAKRELAKQDGAKQQDAATSDPGAAADAVGLLADLRARREQLAMREQTIAQREALVRAAMARVNDRMGELAALQAKLEQLEAARREHEAANWAGLVKLYETMKPREAAVIFNDLEQPVLIGLLDRMKESKAALVLGAMAPDRARDATAALAAARSQRVSAPGKVASGGATKSEARTQMGNGDKGT